MNEYVVIFEEAQDGGWGAYIPDVPGVVALGQTREQAADRIQEALEVFAEEMKTLGKPLPEPLHAAGTARL